MSDLESDQAATNIWKLSRIYQENDQATPVFQCSSRIHRKWTLEEHWCVIGSSRDLRCSFRSFLWGSARSVVGTSTYSGMSTRARRRKIVRLIPSFLFSIVFLWLGGFEPALPWFMKDCSPLLYLHGPSTAVWTDSIILQMRSFLSCNTLRACCHNNFWI